jgi:hypothetical protein
MIKNNLLPKLWFSCSRELYVESARDTVNYPVDTLAKEQPYFISSVSCMRSEQWRDYNGVFWEYHCKSLNLSGGSQMFI